MIAANLQLRAIAVGSLMLGRQQQRMSNVLLQNLIPVLVTSTFCLDAVNADSALRNMHMLRSIKPSGQHIWSVCQSDSKSSNSSTW